MTLQDPRAFAFLNLKLKMMNYIYRYSELSDQCEVIVNASTDGLHCNLNFKKPTIQSSVLVNRQNLLYVQEVVTHLYSNLLYSLFNKKFDGAFQNAGSFLNILFFW